jgi:hypothetical protein
MAWIESHQELARHPKTRKLARKLDVSLPAAIGHLHILWWWALDHAFDGDLTGWDSEDVALGAMWEGDPEVFIKALIESRGASGHGFLEQDGERLFLHDWETYTAHLRARRESAQKANHIRWHSGRNLKDPSCELCRNPNGVASDSLTIPSTPSSESTVPNLTKPNPTEPNQEPKTPSRPDDRDFEEFWKQYPRRQNGSKGSKKEARTAWNKLSPDKRALALSSLTIYEKAKNGYPRDAVRYLRSEEWEGLDNVAEFMREPESMYPWL